MRNGYNPEIFELLQSGKLSLCAVAEIAKVLQPENKTEVIQSSIGKPKAEVQKIAAKYLEVTQPLKREKVVVKRVEPAFERSHPLSSEPSESKTETRFTLTGA